VKRAPLHSHEDARLEALERARILDTPAEATLDRLAKLAAHVTGCPIALFSLVAPDRQWFKSRVGLGATLTGRDESFCAHAVASESALVVEDASEDPRFHDNPLVLNDPQIRFYAGIPVRSVEGLPLGTLCVIDRVPRALLSGQMDALRALAKEVEAQLSLRTALGDAEQEQDDRVQMTALLVHDLRNPLTSVIGGAACLEMDPALSEESREIVLEMIEAGQRMAFQLLDESSSPRAALLPSFGAIEPAAFYQQVSSALNLSARLRGHALQATFTSDPLGGRTLRSDEGLLRRLIDNLFDNALKFSPTGSTVRFSMVVRLGEPLLIRVTDAGPGIPVAERARIFQAGVRLGDGDSPRPKGWGLGLRFVQRAAQALGGHITIADAEPSGAEFTITLPGVRAD
jgi:signal transduction histidine kinase